MLGSILQILTLFFVLVIAADVRADSVYNDGKWLGRPLVVVHSFDTPPLAYVGLNGVPKGVVIDYWHAWSRKNNIPIKIVLTDWPNTLQMLRNGEADIHGGLYANKEREQFLAFSEPYFDLEAALFVRSSLNIRSIDGLKDRPIAVLSGGFSEYWMKENHPEAALQAYSNSAEMVEAAVNGDVDALLTEFATLVHQLGARAMSDAFVPVATLYKFPLRAAVAKENASLLEIVVKGQHNLTSNEKEQIFRRWITRQDDLFPWRFIVYSLGILFVALLGYLLLARVRN